VSATEIGVGVWLVLVAQLVMNAAAYASTPFLVLHFSETLGFDAVETGTAMSVLLLSAKVLPALTGPLADGAGRRLMTVAGMLTRALGFAGLVIREDFWWILLMVFLIGLGGAMFDPATNGVLALQSPAVRPRVFAVHLQFLNIGVVGGPIIGAALMSLGPSGPFAGTSALLFVAALVLGLAARAIPEGEGSSSSLAGGWRTALGHRPFLRFLAIMTSWWIVFAQLQLSFPLHAVRLAGDERWASAVFSVNGIVGIAFAFVVKRLYERWQAIDNLRWGFVLLIMAFSLVPVGPGFGWFLGCVIIYTLAETIILAGGDLLVARLAPEGRASTFFGMASLAWALGGTIGNYAGAWLSLHGGAVVTWLDYASVAAFGALGVWSYREKAVGPTEASPAGGGGVVHPAGDEEVC